MDNKLILLCLIVLLGACSIPPFRTASDGPVAQVAFSSTMPGEPALTVIIDCKEYLIPHHQVDQRKPTEPAKKTMSFPADRIISLNYRYAELDRRHKHPVTQGNRKSGKYRTYLEDQYSPQTCNKTIAFKPESDQNYEVYFGATTNTDCLIFIRKVNSFTGLDKNLQKVADLPVPQCK